MDMKNKVLEINVEQNCVNILQRYSYEIEMLKNRINILTLNHVDDVTFLDSPVYTRLNDELLNKEMEYDRKKYEIITPYIPTEYRGNKYSWNLDFASTKLTIYEMEE